MPTYFQSFKNGIPICCLQSICNVNSDISIWIFHPEDLDVAPSKTHTTKENLFPQKVYSAFLVRCCIPMSTSATSHEYFIPISPHVVDQVFINTPTNTCCRQLIFCRQAVLFSFDIVVFQGTHGLWSQVLIGRSVVCLIDKLIL